MALENQERIKEIRSPDKYFLKAYKIKPVLSVLIFKFSSSLVQEKNLKRKFLFASLKTLNSKNAVLISGIFQKHIHLVTLSLYKNFKGEDVLYPGLENEMYRPNVKAYVQNLDWSHSAVGKNNIFKYLVANATLFGYLFFNSYIGTELRLMRSRFTYNISVGVCSWFCRLDVGF